MNKFVSTGFAFYDFEFDAKSEELFKIAKRKRIDLQPKPAAILALLLKHNGVLVTRKEIQKHIWPDTVIDYNQRISSSIQQIRNALGDDRASPKYIETIPRKGYRFIAPIKALPKQNFMGFSVIEANNRFVTVFRKNILAALLIVALVSSSVLIWSTQIKPALEPKAYIRPLLLILPGVVEANSAPDDALFHKLARGLSDEIISRLSRAQPQILGVIARITAKEFTRDRQSVERAKNQLDATHLLETSIRKNNGKIYVATALVRLSDLTQVWTQTYETQIGDLGVIKNDVANRISTALNLRLRHGVWGTETQGTFDRVAYQNYLTGLAFLNRSQPDSIKIAVSYFQASIDADINYAPAYAALARAYLMSSNQPQAREAVRHALILDSELSEALMIDAHFKFKVDYDFEDAAKSFEKAITRTPGRAEFRLRYADYLTAIGAFDKAIEQASIARELDPLSASLYGELGWFYLRAHKPENAISECKRGLELQKGNIYYALIANDCLVLATSMLGYTDEALIAAQEIMILFGSGDQKINAPQSIQMPDEQLRIYWLWRIETMKKFPGTQIDIAKSYVALGEYEKAIQAVELARKQSPKNMVYLKTDPSWDPIREMPAFQKIIADVFPNTPS